MRKSVWIFLLAVLVPSAVLGWLALRSAEEQKIILERQTTELYQRETESLAAAARALIDEQRRGFAEAVRALLSSTPPSDLAPDFSARLPGAWPRKAVGFTLAADGRVLSPATRLAADKPAWGLFLREHGPFLGNVSAAPVYNVQVDALTQPEQLRKLRAVAQETEGTLSKKSSGGPIVLADSVMSKDLAETKPAIAGQAPSKPQPPGSKMKTEAPAPAPKPAPAAPADKARQDITKSPARKNAAPAEAKQLSASAPAAAPAAPVAAAPPPPAPATSTRAFTPAPTVQAEAQVKLLPTLTESSAAKRDETAAGLPVGSSSNVRVVQPQQLLEPTERAAVSNLLPETAEFRTLSEGQSEGIVARFVQDKLALIFWLRPAQAPELIFGCVVEAADLGDLWPQVMPVPSTRSRLAPQFVLALLNDRARPVATAPIGENNRDWKRPFVASEVGEALPHWEAALYLMRPEQLQESALGLRRTLVFLIAAMLGAIALGGWLVVADARRQLALAQQKTDFVSNVSHELKTPLTSIRMFAELMLGGRANSEKTPQYLRIIMVEAERLTRLINNVLDFAKLERRQKRFDKKPLDLHEVIARVWEGQELHLRESGFAAKWEAAPPPYRVVGDEDALAQILVNLLSNAEKYSGEHKEIELHTYLDDDHVCVSVLDRGFGVPAGSERKIFDAFYRAHDSLSSGIQGSGLGLTLALRLAAEHGGAIEYRSRDGGGSAFTLKLPIASA